MRTTYIAVSLGSFIVTVCLFHCFCRSDRECWETYAGSMQQQPGDGSDHVPGRRRDRRGAQHQLKFSSLKQQSSPFRVI